MYKNARKIRAEESAKQKIKSREIVLFYKTSLKCFCTKKILGYIYIIVLIE